MPAARVCPEPQQLQRFLLGRVSHLEALHLEQHLKECAPCQQILAEVDLADDLMNTARRVDVASANLSPPELDQMIDRLVGLGQEAKGSAAGSNPLEVETLLTPAQAPGEMGRLGPYRILNVLGAGGMGVVFRAEDTRLGRLVALKVMSPRLAESVSARQRFLREAKSAARLRHPAIVPLYEVGGEDGPAFLAYALVEGPTLARLVLEVRPTHRQAAEWVARLADALDYAHNAGIIHRDVKPANVVMDDAGRPMLADFGIALQTDALADLTHEGDIVGTPAYMAPEQAAGRKSEIGRLSDVYSLGALLYELLCGRPPFQGSLTSIIHQAVHNDPPPPHHFRPGIPRDLVTICQKAMAKEPSRRYPSAGALAEDLQRYLQHLPIRARRLGPLGRLALWCRRKPALATSIALGVLTSLSIGIYSFDRVVRERDRFHQERDRAQLLLASRALDKGISLCDEGEIAQGMLWFARGLRETPASASGLLWAFQSNLSAWRPLLARRQVTVGDTRPVRAVAYHPNGRVLVSAGDGFICSFDAASGEPLGKLQALNRILSPNCRLTFSREGHTVLADISDLWDADTGQAIGLTGLNEDTIRLASADGRYLLTFRRDEKEAILWETSSRRRVAVIQRAKINAQKFDFAPSTGRLAVIDSAHTCWLWQDVKSAPAVLAKRIQVAAFAPDGRTLWLAGDDKSARAWDAVRGRPLDIVLPHQATVMALALTSDGRAIVTGSADRTARVWDAQTGRPLSPPLHHPGRVSAVAWAPDGRALVTGCQDQGGVHVWELPEIADPRPVLHHEHPVWAMALSGDGRRLLTGCGTVNGAGAAQLWDVASGERLGQALPCRGMLIAVAISRDGQTLATGDWSGVVQLWEASSKRPLGPPLQKLGGNIVALALSPDEHTLLTDRIDVYFTPEQLHTSSQLWDPATRHSKGSLIGHELAIRDAAFSHDGRLLLTGSYDQTARLWDPQTLTPLGQPFWHEGAVGAVAFSPDARFIVVGSDDGRAKVWEVASGRFIGPPLLHQGTVRKVAYSPDGRLILTGSTDQTARLWESTTHKPVGPTIRHDDAIEAGTFTPDGRMFLTGSRDKTVRFWPVPVPLKGDPEHIALWVEVMTGLQLDEDGLVVPLAAENWRIRKRQLGDREP